MKQPKMLTAKEWQIVCGSRLLRLQDAFIREPTNANKSRMLDAADEYQEASRSAGKERK